MSQKIIVVISDGCADVLEKPDNIELEIRDYDVETSWDEDNDSCKLDSEDARYQEMIFPATKIKFSANGDSCFTDVEINYKKFIGWQPDEEDFPAGLQTFEVYEDLKMGIGCHPEVKKWIEIFEGMIEKPIIIPSDN